MENSSDVVVVGGGPAGLATSLALRSIGYRVVLIERSSYRDIRVGEHLTPIASHHLDALEIAHLLSDAAHLRCPGILSAWGRADLNATDYIFNPFGQGYNLARPAFDAAMAEVAMEREVTMLRNARLRKLSRVNGGWRIEAADKDGLVELRASFVVDATGRGSSVARGLGATRGAVDRMIGIAGYVAATPDPNSSILIESVRNGWWYMAPLADGRLVATFMTDSHQLSSDPSTPYEFWEKNLCETKHVVARIAADSLPNEVLVRPSESQILDSPGGLGWLAVGDAAMSYDPLSSLGISKALEQGMEAAGAIDTFLKGDSHAIPRYIAKTRKEFDRYLAERVEYYQMEARWPDSSFWHSRRVPCRSPDCGHEFHSVDQSPDKTKRSLDRVIQIDTDKRLPKGLERGSKVSNDAKNGPGAFDPD